MKWWYEGIRDRGEIPALPHLTWMVHRAIVQRDNELWETVVDRHMDEYMKRMEEDPELPEARLRVKYAETIWSSAVRAYIKKGNTRRAMTYYCRIVQAGGYPRSNACAALLNLLSKQAFNKKVPVVPQSWSDADAKDVCSMEPAAPPGGVSEENTFIRPESMEQRQQLVAEIGLAMLYEMLRHRCWPASYFYTALFMVLGKAQMIDSIQQVHEVVIPKVQSRMARGVRCSPDLWPSPSSWMMLLMGTVWSDRRDLGRRWLREYREEAMPKLRDSILHEAKEKQEKLPQSDELCQLSRPYYVIPRIDCPVLDDGSLPSPWYDLSEVDLQLELDRQRESDGVSLSFKDAQKMLRIYTRIPERRDMELAEKMASHIKNLFQNPRIPQADRPLGHEDLAYCWKLMVAGYCALVREQKHDAYCQSAIYWHHVWTTACWNAQGRVAQPGNKHAIMDQEDGRTIRQISSKASFANQR
ncbi:hypothetical protein GGF46_005400 [Coemansia sp. RSA 552]|nr:hypothetical protein GGF46_005400 [Coemansia sp. RSA 552]